MALINANSSNSVYAVQVLNQGSGIYAAGAYINVDPSVGVTNTASFRVIAAPEGGHGANVASELYCNTVGISVTFSNTEVGTIPISGGYQSVGLIRNPTFANVQFIVAGNTAAFSKNEIVTQTIGNVTSSGKVISTFPLQITNASSTWQVSPSNTAGLIVGQTSQQQAQILSYTISGQQKPFTTFTQYYQYLSSDPLQLSPFNSGDLVYQTNPKYSNAIFYANSVDGQTLYVTSKLGPIYTGNTLNNYTVSTTTGLPTRVDSKSFYINSVTLPDLVAESGDVLYIENFNTVNRASNQSETIKLLLNF
jgi:hypothetical protein